MRYFGNSFIVSDDAKQFSDAINDVINAAGDGVDAEIQYKPVMNDRKLVFTALITYSKPDIVEKEG